MGWFSKKTHDCDIVLKSDDIHCEMCAETVKHTLKQVAGVSKVKVSLKKKTIEVSVDERADVTSRTLIDALKPSGYQAMAVEGESR